MNKLLLIFLGVLAIAAIVSAWDNEEDSSLSEELASSRLVRSADARRKRKRGRNARKGKKGKKGRRRRKGNKGRKNQSGSRSHGRAASDACLETSITVMKMWKDVISNFEKQKKRMKKQNETGLSKTGKKGLFDSVYQRLLSAGGGDKTSLACAGRTDSEGAAWLTNLTSSLAACQTDISSACDPSTWPQPNITKAKFTSEKVWNEILIESFLSFYRTFLWLFLDL